MESTKSELANKPKIIKQNIKTTMNHARLFKEFMNQHYVANDKPITNTRIGDKENGISGGSYHIPKEKYNQFSQLYYNAVFCDNKPEYLTETQLEKDGPILVDIDLHHSYDVCERIITTENIDDMLLAYSKLIGEKSVIQMGGIGLRYFNVYGHDERHKGNMIRMFH